jgi:hypothetical protein
MLLGCDPLETDTNLYRYCVNQPLTHTDPFGEQPERINYDRTAGYDIDPSVRDKLAGSSWKLHRDVPHESFVQEVDDEGSLLVKVLHDNEYYYHEVKWHEIFRESWTIGGNTHVDMHYSRPQRPAQYLEKMLGQKFKKNEGKLMLGDDVVCEWEFKMKATFKAGTGNYGLRKGYAKGKLQFEITELTLYSNPQDNPQPKDPFTRMLYPGGNLNRDLDDLGLNSRFNCNDTWEAKYKDGDKKVINYYKTSGY